MTEFITNPSSKVKSAVKVTGGGLTVASVVWIYATFATKADIESAERRAMASRDEMRASQSRTWQKLMDVQLAVEANRATLDMFIKMHAGKVGTNAVVIR